MQHRRYTKANRIDAVAKYYYQKTGRGITYVHLLREGIAKHKSQAQNTLKVFRMKRVLFTIDNRRPQEYYPMSIKSEIMQARMSKNAPIQPTGSIHNSRITHSLIDNVINQSLLDYILPLLPAAPLHIHNLHFKLKINPECYENLDLSTYKNNHGRHLEVIIDNFLVSFTIYKNGTIEIYISSSNNPFELDTDVDLGRLLVYIGQIRQYLLQLLCDSRGRIVPDAMEWELTECDINKDIPVSDIFHFTGLKIQVRHFHHVLRIYFKAIGRDTVCRVEKSISPKKPAIDTINEIFNLNDK